MIGGAAPHLSARRYLADVRLRVEDGHDGLRVEVGPAAPAVLPRPDSAATADVATSAAAALAAGAAAAEAAKLARVPRAPDSAHPAVVDGEARRAGLLLVHERIQRRREVVAHREARVPSRTRALKKERTLKRHKPCEKEKEINRSRDLLHV